MVNSKRMSKSKVAMIALAILLVLSLVLTATGAWFTGVSEGTTADQTFGHLVINAGGDEALTVTKAEVSTGYLMPGDSIDDIVIEYNSNVYSFARYKVEIVVTGAADAAEVAVGNRTPEQANLVALQTYFDEYFGDDWHYVTGYGATNRADGHGAPLPNLYSGVDDEASLYTFTLDQDEIGEENDTDEYLAERQLLAPALGAGIVIEGFTIDGDVIGNFAQDAEVSITVTVQAIQAANFSTASTAWNYVDNGNGSTTSGIDMETGVATAA